MRRNWPRSKAELDTATPPHTRSAWQRQRQSLVILGVDPGTLVTGFGVIEHRGGKMRLIECGAIRNTPAQSLPLRLEKIYAGLRSVIEKHKPDEFAIESAFYGKNAQSALKLGHARGVSILAAVEREIPTSEYSPREIKKSVVGNGQASKIQVQYMVKSLLDIRDRRMLTDTSDAIATAICHLHRISSPQPKYQDWKSFLAAHPELLRK